MKPYVIYQIYLRNFTLEGTLKGAEKMLPHIAGLGVDMIYLSAMNTADDSVIGQSKRQLASGMNNPKNPYRITDYFNVDEEYGTIDDLKSFISAAHGYGLKVLIDLVYLHCGTNAVFLAENPDFVIRNENGEIKLGNAWPFARLNYENPQLCEYLWSNMEFYIREMDADGFRCDVGSMIPIDFWKKGVERIKKIKPDVFMLNEGSGDKFLSVFDCNYYAEMGFFYSISKIFAYNSSQNKKQLDKQAYQVHEEAGTAYTGVWFKNKRQELYNDTNKFRLLNTWENHDNASDLFEDRLEKILGNDACDAILALLFTLDGIPMIYNGNEVADDSRKSMFWNRFCVGNMTVQWENLATQKGKKRMDLVKNLIHLRRKYKSLQDGNLVWLEHSNQENVIAFMRIFENDKKNIVVNITPEVQTIKLDTKAFGKQIMCKNSFVGDGEIVLLPYGFIVTE